MSEEWGPWIDHDGKGCPCRGALVESEMRNGLIDVHIAEGGAVYCDGSVAPSLGGLLGSAWVWEDEPLPSDVVRYRVRKPRGLTILESLIADLPAPVGPKVDA